MSAAELVFWASLLLLAYTLLGYPLLLRAWAALFPRPLRSARIEPAVSLVIVAQDEEARMQARLENVLALDYARDRLEITLCSDGSRDQTVARARTFTAAGVRVVAFASRRGKPSVLNDVVPTCCGEIVVLADARQRFEADALRHLVQGFADPKVGAVSGELVLDAAGGAVAGGVGFYWRCEKAIRASEARVDSVVGATGAIYAFRRALWEPLPPDTILDDVLLPLRIARRGYRVVFEPRARAHDRAAATPEQELKRKVRTIAGTFQLLSRERWLLDPFRNRLFVQTVSHKGLRLLIPFLLVAALVANLLLLDAFVYRAWLAAQLACYAAALAGHAFRDAGRASRLFAVPYVVCLLAWATLLGLARFVGGSQPVTWAKTGSSEVS